MTWPGCRVPSGLAKRARIVLLAADGVPNAQIARTVGVSRPTLIGWRDRYAAGGPASTKARRRDRARQRLPYRAPVHVIPIRQLPNRASFDSRITPDRGEQLHSRPQLSGPFRDHQSVGDHDQARGQFKLSQPPRRVGNWGQIRPSQHGRQVVPVEPPQAGTVGPNQSVTASRCSTLLAATTVTSNLWRRDRPVKSGGPARQPARHA
jgi:Winged helix-turn helix